MDSSFITHDKTKGLAYLSTTTIERELTSIGIKTHTNQSIFHPNIIFWNNDTYQDYIERQIMELCELGESIDAVKYGAKLPNMRHHREYYKLFLQPNLEHTLETLLRTLKALKRSNLKISGKINYRLPAKGNFEVIVLYAYPRAWLS